MKIQSKPAPAQISATSGEPEHTQIPDKGVVCVVEGVLEGRIRFYEKWHVTVPIRP